MTETKKQTGIGDDTITKFVNFLEGKNEIYKLLDKIGKDVLADYLARTDSERYVQRVRDMGYEVTCINPFLEDYEEAM